MDLKRASLLLIFLIPASGVLSACNPDSPAPAAASFEAVPQEGIAWVRKHAVPLATDKPGGSLKDLAPLEAEIGNARVVALGEATHGTSEFFRMKHRLLEFLVEKMGFDHFVLEATWAETALIDDYVQGGPGNPEGLLAHLGFWPWNTREMLDLIAWMRAYNQRRRTGKPVRFVGMDMQDPRGAIVQVVRYLRGVDERKAAAASDSYRCLEPAAGGRGLNELYQRYPALSPDEQNACRRGLEAIQSWFLQHVPGRDDEAARGFEPAFGSARMLVQLESLLRHRSLRDRFMADNVAWLLERAGPGSKAVVWAHNGHVNNLPGLMGGSLKKRFGDQVVLVGFLFYRGTFNAVRLDANGRFGRLETFHAELPPEDTWEYAFHEAGRPLVILDLRGSQSGTLPACFLKPYRVRKIGASYQPSHPESGYAFSRLAKEYDLMIYFDQIRASTLLGSQL